MLKVKQHSTNITLKTFSCPTFASSLPVRFTSIMKVLLRLRARDIAKAWI